MVNVHEINKALRPSHLLFAHNGTNFPSLAVVGRRGVCTHQQHQQPQKAQEFQSLFAELFALTRRISS